jgi:hypothetical protein
VNFLTVILPNFPHDLLEAVQVVGVPVPASEASASRKEELVGGVRVCAHVQLSTAEHVCGCGEKRAESGAVEGDPPHVKPFARGPQSSVMWPRLALA